MDLQYCISFRCTKKWLEIYILTMWSPQLIRLVRLPRFPSIPSTQTTQASLQFSFQQFPQIWHDFYHFLSVIHPNAFPLVKSISHLAWNKYSKGLSDPLKTLSWTSFPTCFSIIPPPGFSMGPACVHVRVHVSAFLYLSGRDRLVPSMSFFCTFRDTGYLWGNQHLECRGQHLTRTMVLVFAGYSPQKATRPQEIKGETYHFAVSRDSLDITENNLEFRKKFWSSFGPCLIGLKFTEYRNHDQVVFIFPILLLKHPTGAAGNIVIVSFLMRPQHMHFRKAFCYIWCWEVHRDLSVYHSG